MVWLPAVLVCEPQSAIPIGQNSGVIIRLIRLIFITMCIQRLEIVDKVWFNPIFRFWLVLDSYSIKYQMGTFRVITTSVLPPLGPVLYSLGVTPWRILIVNIAWWPSVSNCTKSQKKKHLKNPNTSFIQRSTSFWMTPQTNHDQSQKNIKCLFIYLFAYYIVDCNVCKVFFLSRQWFNFIL